MLLAVSDECTDQCTRSRNPVFSHHRQSGRSRKATIKAFLQPALGLHWRNFLGKPRIPHIASPLADQNQRARTHRANWNRHETSKQRAARPNIQLTVGVERIRLSVLPPTLRKVLFVSCFSLPGPQLHHDSRVPVSFECVISVSHS
jgi:hypothetical protein